MCLLINEERERISRFFKTFSTDFIQTPIKRIGEPSVNGFIHHIHYHNDNYDAYAVMKSAAREDADNLIYEYLVGKELNKYRSRFPNLVETYGLYHYRSDDHWDRAQNMKSITTEPKKMEYLEGLEKVDEEMNLKNLLTFSCENSKHLAVLIENIKNPKTLDSLLDEEDFKADDFLCILFQVYFLLHSLKDVFTHYDLHANNVLIIDFGKDKYIEYVYHISGRDVIMKCRYLAKIIDYGRSYIKDKSEKIHTELCKIDKCKKDPTDCGYEYGYGWLYNGGPDYRVYYVRSTKLNNSHDLRLLTNMSFLNDDHHDLYKEIDDLLSSVVYIHRFGTPARKRSPKTSPTSKPDGMWSFFTKPKTQKTQTYKNKIYCVSEAMLELKRLITGEDYRIYNEGNYIKKTSVGILEVYNGRPFVFTPSKPTI